VTIAVVADPQYGPAVCHACGAAIVWALTDSGRRMPVDFAPSLKGPLELFTEHFPDGEPVEAGVQRVRLRPAARPPSSPAWSVHWSTCAARRRPPRLSPELAAQVEAAVVRKWGPLFAVARWWGRA
jgi:hypothetical protein